MSTIQRSNNGWLRLQITDNTPSFLDIFKRNQIKTLHELGKFCKSKMDYYAPVDTGYLKSRNDYRITQDKNLILLNDCHYAIFQEYGTRFQSGTPFMRPAVYSHFAEMSRIAGRGLADGIS